MSRDNETLAEVQLMLSRHKNMPITTPDIFAEVAGENKANSYKAIQIKDDEWKERIRCGMWWYHENDTAPTLAPGRTFDYNLFALRDKLLSFGGEEVCLPAYEEDLFNILKYGQLWYSSFESKKGEPSQCHRNACYCWDKNEDYADGTLRICTGYALSADGMWRQHSWLAYKTPRSVHIVETTEPRKLYFGFAMTHKMCEEFYAQNC